MPERHIANLSRRLAGFDPFLGAESTAASWKGALKSTRKAANAAFLVLAKSVFLLYDTRASEKGMGMDRSRLTKQ